MLIPKYSRSWPLAALILILSVAVFDSCGGRDDSGEDSPEAAASRVASLVELMESSSGTVEGLAYARELYHVADSADDVVSRNYALIQELTMLHALAKYADCIALADSLVNNSSLRRENLVYYYMAIYVKMVALIDQGKYKTAVQIAQKLYDDSRVDIVDENGVNITLQVRCNALLGLGMANDEMGREREAVEYYSEGINALGASTQKKEYLSQLLEMQTCRMLAGRKLPDKMKALGYVAQYQQEFNDFRRLSVGTPFENIFIDDYALLMHTAFIDVFTDLGRLAEAQRSVEHADSIVGLYEMADQYIAELNTAKSHFYAARGDFQASIDYADSAMLYFSDKERRTGEIDVLKTKLRGLHGMGHFDEEYPLTQKIFSLSDSLYHDRINSQVEDMQTVLDMDKLEHTANEMRTKMQLWVIIAIASILVGIIVIIAFKRRKDNEKRQIISAQRDMLQREVEMQTRQLRKQKEDIEAANEVLAKSNAQIEQQNVEIRGSIEYALLIQQSILPRLDDFQGLGDGGCFAFYLPCKIVSGDFYWYRHRDDVDIIVLADCTGHGVPGAFMTMIGTTILGDICDHSEVRDPARILELLHSNLIGVLQQNGEQNSKDGMDVAIVVVDRAQSTVTVSSARRPIFFYHNGVGDEIEGVKVKRSIGERDYNAESRPFQQKTLSVTRGDAIYIFSDGITDTFGGDGPKARKFSLSRLKNTMDEMAILPVDRQYRVVEKAFYDWISANGKKEKENWDQPDDVSFIGVVL
ncbi:MAG: PP2C family protein-serine/threonine phosphatase [Marinilabiliaceae bacterium]